MCNSPVIIDAVKIELYVEIILHLVTFLREFIVKKTNKSPVVFTCRISEKHNILKTTENNEHRILYKLLSIYLGFALKLF